MEKSFAKEFQGVLSQDVPIMQEDLGVDALEASTTTIGYNQP